MPGYEGYDISHNKDGSITFICSPKDAGTYKISVERDGKALSGLPICCVVQESPAGYVTAYKTGNDVDTELSQHAETLHSHAGTAVEEEDPGLAPDLEQGAVMREEEEEGIILSLLQSGEAVYLPSEEGADVDGTTQQQQPGQDQVTIVHLDQQQLEQLQQEQLQQEQLQQEQLQHDQISQEQLQQEQLQQEQFKDEQLQQEQFQQEQTTQEQLQQDQLTQEQFQEQLQQEQLTKEQLQEQQLSQEQLQEQQLTQEQLQEQQLTQEQLQEQQLSQEQLQQQQLTQEQLQEQQLTQEQLHEQQLTQEHLQQEYLVQEQSLDQENMVVEISGQPQHLQQEQLDNTEQIQLQVDEEQLQLISDGQQLQPEQYQQLQEEAESKHTVLISIPAEDGSEWPTTSVHEISDPDAIATITAAAASQLVVQEGGTELAEGVAQGEVVLLQHNLEQVKLEVEDGAVEVDEDLISMLENESQPIEEMKNVTIKPEPEKGEAMVQVTTRRSGRSITTPAKYRGETYIKPEPPNPLKRTPGRPRVPIADMSQAIQKVKEKREAEHVEKDEKPKPMFPCPDCGKVYTNPSRLEKHSTTHTQRVFICDVIDCKKQFKVLQTLIDHREKKHKLKVEVDTEMVTCGAKKCDEKFASLPEMHKHLVASHKEEHICKICYRVLGSSVKLVEHLDTHSEVPKFHCDFEGCDRSFKTKRLLELHIRTHDGGDLCPECGKEFTTRGNLNKHIELVHLNPKEPRIPSSGIVTPELSSNELRSLMCDSCGKFFTNRNCLKTHIREMHVMEELKIIESEQEMPYRPFKCGYCGKGFKRQAVLKQHIANHESTSRVVCSRPGCTKSFPTIFKLKDHLRMVHKNEGKLHKCEAPGCDKTFKTASALNVHMKKHSNIRFPCLDESCNRHFSTKFCMMNHYKLVHEQAEPDQVCPICHKAFKLKLQLDRHIETHVDKREHQCPTCGKGYKTKSTLASHVKIHQHETQHRCELCGKGFARKYRLQEHMLSHAQPTQQVHIQVEQTQVEPQDAQQEYIPTELATFEVHNAITELQNSSGKHILIIEPVDLPEGMEF